MKPHRTIVLVAGLAALAAAPASRPAPVATGLPPLVFVSRQPLPGGLGVPGIGPTGRTAAAGGRLMVLRSGGIAKPLLADGACYDVSDPAVSWDGRRIAFAGLAAPESSWRIYTVNADGRGLAPLTRDDGARDLSSLGAAAARFARFDDFDPCWLPDGRVCFASTRFPQIAEVGGVPSSNLYVVNADGTRLRRISSERNGAEEPTVDLETGRIVFARWWTNRFFASERDPSGITTDRALAVPSDTVDLWQAITITPDGDLPKLAGGNPRVRLETMAYQPLVLRDGTLIGVRAEEPSLFPAGGGLTLVAFPRRFAPARVIAGGEGRSACAPAALPDGRIVFSYDAAGSGDFGLFVAEPDGRGLARVLDLPGTLELDAAPLAARRLPPVLRPIYADLPHALPVSRNAELHDLVDTFRFDCLNVFANAPVDFPVPDAVPFQSGVRIRFYAVLARPDSPAGDTAVLVRESTVDRTGQVHEHDLPADAPMFEQLVDAHGHVLRSTMGPAQVPGFNSGRFGGGTKCVGCHLGHSVIPVAESAHLGKVFNAATSASVAASSVAPGTAGARAAVDRRARGPAGEVGWIAGSLEDQQIALSWRSPIDLETLVLYAIGPLSAAGTDLRIRECELAFYCQGREIRRQVIRRELSPSGTRIECQGIRVDSLEVRPTRSVGRILGRAAVGLAEIETLARLPEN